MVTCILRFLALLILVGGSSAAHATSVRSSLIRCSEPIASVDENFGKRWDFNAANVSLAYGAFAAAAANAYTDDLADSVYLPTQSLKNIGWAPLRWQKAPNDYRFSSGFTGLSFDSYVKDADTCVFVIVAIRGTDPTSLADWYSNFSWLTAIVPTPNQYRQINKKFKELRNYAETKYSGKKINYITTGHSLGGGLAIHLASCFDDVGAVVFNSSFVHNTFGCTSKNPKVVEIYDREEILSKIRDRFGKSRSKHVNNAELSTYGINPYEGKNTRPIAQHSMDVMALSMLRMPLDCEVQKMGCNMSRQLLADSLATSKTLLCDNVNVLVRRAKPDDYNFKRECRK